MIRLLEPLIFLLLVCTPLMSQSANPQLTSSSTAKSQPSAADNTSSTEPRCESIEIVREAKPRYPAEAKGQNIRGEVVVRVHVSPSGDVSAAEVASGDPILAGPSLQAAKAWKYKGFHQQIPVECWTNVRFRFSGSDFGEVPIRIRVSEALAESNLRHRVEPSSVGVKGVVVAWAAIAEDGTVEKVSPVSGPPELFPAAIEAARQWRYRPYLLNGRAVGMDTLITVKFKH